MEALTLKLSEPDEYDRLVHSGLMQASGVQIVTKDKGTDQGNPVAVIAFDALLPDGSTRQVQATVTVRLLQMAAAATIGRYGQV